MDRVRWGVMGTADIAASQTIPGLMQADNALLHAVAGRDPGKAEQFRDRFGFGRSYGSYDELLDDPDVEAVYIPLPNSLHCSWAVKALQAGKHVLCEKPAAVSEEEAKLMYRTAAENGVYLMEAFAYLHSPFIEALRGEVARGSIGELRYIESSFLTGRRPDGDIRMRRETAGGSLFDLGCYCLSWILWMAGGEPDGVHAFSEFTEEGIDIFSSALLTYSSGLRASFSCGMMLPYGRQDLFALYGTEGRITTPVQFNQPGELSYTVAGRQSSETRRLTSLNNYRLEFEQLGRCVRGLEKPRLTAEFSLMNARVMDRILESCGYRDAGRRTGA